MFPLKYLLAFVIVATLTNSAFADVCYHCQSSKNRDCGENFRRYDIESAECLHPDILSVLKKKNAKPDGCMKVVTKAEDGTVVVMRSCGISIEGAPSDACKNDPSMGVECSICHGDLCNCSPSMGPFAVATVVFFGLARIFA